MSPIPRKSTQVAIGGVSTALCLLLMVFTAILPFAEYALPALAGVILIAVVAENGSKSAIIVYMAVSLLSPILVPRPEAAMLFVFFFGYYPILQFRLNQIQPKVIQYLVKFLLFNIAIIGAYFLMIQLFGITGILDSFGNFGQYSVLILLGLGNLFFIVYDFSVFNLCYIYLYWFRPKFLYKTR